MRLYARPIDGVASAHRAVLPPAVGTALRMDAVQYSSIPIPDIYSDFYSGRIFLHAVHFSCRVHLLRDHKFRSFSLLLVSSISSFDGRDGPVVRLAPI